MSLGWLDTCWVSYQSYSVSRLLASKTWFLKMYFGPLPDFNWSTESRASAIHPFQWKNCFHFLSLWLSFTVIDSKILPDTLSCHWWVAAMSQWPEDYPHLAVSGVAQQLKSPTLRLQGTDKSGMSQRPVSPVEGNPYVGVWGVQLHLKSPTCRLWLFLHLWVSDWTERLTVTSGCAECRGTGQSMLEMSWVIGFFGDKICQCDWTSPMHCNGQLRVVQPIHTCVPVYTSVSHFL